MAPKNRIGITTQGHILLNQVLASSNVFIVEKIGLTTDIFELEGEEAVITGSFCPLD
jgi:hypothetical protein